MILKTDELLHQIQFSFLVSHRVIEMELKRHTELDSTHVHCIFTIYDIESMSYYCQLKWPNSSFKSFLCETEWFLYARLKNGRIMLYPPASVRPSVRPSVCKLFRFRVTPPTVYVRLSWNLVYMKAMRWFNAYYLEVMVQRFLAELQPFN